VPDETARRAVLSLLYSYRNLNNTDLIDLPTTSLISHKVRLAPGTKSYSVKSQKR
jgi:hypothetical protein